MKPAMDFLLLGGMALCYGLGQLAGWLRNVFISARLAEAAVVLLLVFVLRLLGSALGWMLGGR